jgi:hypothetical protein
MNLSL